MHIKQMADVARSRTPSPMYLELPSGLDRQFSEDEGSGAHTPRKQWQTSQGMHPLDNCEKKVATKPLHSQPDHASLGSHQLGNDISRIVRTSGDHTHFPKNIGFIPPPGLFPLPAAFDETAISKGLPLPVGLVHPPPAAFDETASRGSRGHPNGCEKICKYFWKRKGCRDGMDCSHCHLCSPKGAANPKVKTGDGNGNEPTKPRASAVQVSIGSLGHPLSCAAPCKFNSKKAGCKDGRLCDRCHICRWSRCADRQCAKHIVVDVQLPSKMKEAQGLSTTKEVGTQTTADQSTQCELGDEVLNKDLCGKIINELRGLDQKNTQ